MVGFFWWLRFLALRRSANAGREDAGQESENRTFASRSQPVRIRLPTRELPRQPSVAAGLRNCVGGEDAEDRSLLWAGRDVTIQACRDRCLKLVVLAAARDDYQQIAQTLAARKDAEIQLRYVPLFEAAAAIGVAEADCVLLDMSASQSTDLLQQLRSACQGGIVAMSGASKEHLVVDLLRQGADNVVNREKMTPDSLDRAIRSACQQAQSRQQLAAQLAELEAANERLQRKLAERRASQKVLRQRERQIRFIADNLPILIAHVGADERYRYVNRGYSDFHGLPVEQIVGMHVRELVGPGNYDAAADQIRLVLSGQPTCYQMDVKRPRQPPRTVRVTYLPNHTEDGATDGFLVIVADVTPQRKAEAQLVDSERRFRELAGTVPQILVAARTDKLFGSQQRNDFTDAVLEVAQAIVLLRDSQGGVVRWNRYLEDLTGYSLAEVEEPDRLQLLFGPDALAQAEEAFRQAFADQPSRGRVTPLRTSSGIQREISWWDKVLRSPTGEITGVLSLGHDVTELYEAQRRALQAERLAAIGEAMTALAHESRNALQRSQANLEMLALAVEDRPEALEFIRRAQKAQDDLHQLYEDVREYATPIRIHPREEPLPAVVQETWEQLATLREGRQAELHLHVKTDATSCEVDRFAMRQVFRNILENALAACSDSVRIDVCLELAQWDGQEALRVTLRDNGPGFSNETRQKVFDVFFTTKTHGTGLGMAIARRLVEAHGGHIAIGADAQEGAEFVIHLPRRRP